MSGKESQNKNSNEFFDRKKLNFDYLYKKFYGDKQAERSDKTEEAGRTLTANVPGGSNDAPPPNPEISKENLQNLSAILKKEKGLDVKLDQLQQTVFYYALGKHEGGKPQASAKKIIDAIIDLQKNGKLSEISFTYFGGTDASKHFIRKAKKWHEAKVKAFDKLLELSAAGRTMPSLDAADIAKINEYKQAVANDTFVAFLRDPANKAAFLDGGSLFDVVLCFQRANNMKKKLTGGELTVKDLVELDLGGNVETDQERHSGVIINITGEIKAPVEAEPVAPTEPAPVPVQPEPEDVEVEPVAPEADPTSYELSDQNGLYLNIKTEKGLEKKYYKLDIPADVVLTPMSDKGDQYVHIKHGDKQGWFEYIPSEDFWAHGEMKGKEDKNIWNDYDFANENNTITITPKDENVEPEPPVAEPVAPAEPITPTEPEAAPETLNSYTPETLPIKLYGEDIVDYQGKALVIDGQKISSVEDLKIIDGQFNGKVVFNENGRVRDLPVINGKIIREVEFAGQKLPIISCADVQNISGQLNGRVEIRLTPSSDPQWFPVIDGKIYTKLTSDYDITYCSHVEVINGQLNGRFTLKKDGNEVSVPVINGNPIFKLDGFDILKTREVKNINGQLNGRVELEDNEMYPVINGQLVMKFGDIAVDYFHHADYGDLRIKDGKFNGIVESKETRYPLVDGQLITKIGDWTIKGKNYNHFEGVFLRNGLLNGVVTLENNSQFLVRDGKTSAPVIQGQEVKKVEINNVIDGAFYGSCKTKDGKLAIIFKDQLIPLDANIIYIAELKATKDHYVAFVGVKTEQGIIYKTMVDGKILGDTTGHSLEFTSDSKHILFTTKTKSYPYEVDLPAGFRLEYNDSPYYTQKFINIYNSQNISIGFITIVSDNKLYGNINSNDYELAITDGQIKVSLKNQTEKSETWERNGMKFKGIKWPNGNIKLGEITFANGDTNKGEYDERGWLRTGKKTYIEGPVKEEIGQYNEHGKLMTGEQILRNGDVLSGMFHLETGALRLGTKKIGDKTIEGIWDKDGKVLLLKEEPKTELEKSILDLERKFGLRIKLSKSVNNKETIKKSLPELEMALAKLSEDTRSILKRADICISYKDYKPVQWSGFSEGELQINLNINKHYLEIFNDLVDRKNSFLEWELYKNLLQYGISDVGTFNTARYDTEFYESLYKIKDAFDSLDSESQNKLRAIKLPLRLTPLNWLDGHYVNDEGLVKVDDMDDYYLNLDPSEDVDTLVDDIKEAIEDYEEIKDTITPEPPAPPAPETPAAEPTKPAEQTEAPKENGLYLEGNKLTFRTDEGEKQYNIMPLPAGVTVEKDVSGQISFKKGKDIIALISEEKGALESPILFKNPRFEWHPYIESKGGSALGVIELQKYPLIVYGADRSDMTLDFGTPEAKVYKLESNTGKKVKFSQEFRHPNGVKEVNIKVENHSVAKVNVDLNRKVSASIRAEESQNYGLTIQEINDKESKIIITDLKSSPATALEPAPNKDAHTPERKAWAEKQVEKNKSALTKIPYHVTPEIRENQFKEIINYGGTVVVDITSKEGCEPCKYVDPLFYQVAGSQLTQDDKLVKFAQVESQYMDGDFQAVNGIDIKLWPTTLVFKNSILVGRVEGKYDNAEELKSIIEKILELADQYPGQDVTQKYLDYKENLLNNQLLENITNNKPINTNSSLAGRLDFAQIEKTNGPWGQILPSPLPGLETKGGYLRYKNNDGSYRYFYKARSQEYLELKFGIPEDQATLQEKIEKLKTKVTSIKGKANIIYIPSGNFYSIEFNDLTTQAEYDQLKDFVNRQTAIKNYSDYYYGEKEPWVLLVTPESIDKLVP